MALDGLYMMSTACMEKRDLHNDVTCSNIIFDIQLESTRQVFYGRDFIHFTFLLSLCPDATSLCFLGSLTTGGSFAGSQNDECKHFHANESMIGVIRHARNMRLALHSACSHIQQSKLPLPHDFKKSHTGSEHLIQHAHQSSILQRSSNTFLVSQLLGDLLVGAVGAFLDPNVYSETWRQCLLQTHTHAQADHCGERAMCDCGCDFDSDGRDAGARVGGRGDVDVGELDYIEGAEREGMLGVGDGGDQVCVRMSVLPCFMPV